MKVYNIKFQKMRKAAIHFSKTIVPLLLLLSLFSCGKDDPEPIKPVADFSHTISTSSPGMVRFSNLSENANSYVWDFGDESEPSTEESPMHTFLTNGTYEVTLTAEGDQGKLVKEIHKVTKTITVDNAAPLTAKMEGAEFFDFVANAISLEENFSSTVITGYSGDQYIRIILPAEVSEGVYDLYSMEGVAIEFIQPSGIWSANYDTYCSSGIITVTKVTGSSISASFTGELYKNADCDLGWFVIHSGNFTAEY